MNGADKRWPRIDQEWEKACIGQNVVTKPPEDFEFDVALSFLAKDEPLALRLADLIRERLRTFIYSKEQEQLAGRDGEEKFAQVFGRGARIVVVLHRQGWGTTPWTRVEMRASLFENVNWKIGGNFRLTRAHTSTQ